MNRDRLLFVFCVFLFLQGCEPVSLLALEQDMSDATIFPSQREYRDFDTTSFSLNPDHEAIINMRKRAYQIANIQWMPENEVPRITGVFYPAHIPVKGILYSSVKEKDKFVGQEVSFHTFMTAVHNPKSVLYTEKVDDPPYYGTNCAAYYGTVCSMAVNYALGIERPYIANMYRTLPIFQRVSVQNLSRCCDGDVIWVNGHVILITKVVRNESGEIDKVEILESAGNTSIKNYSFKSFQERWSGQDWVLLRYKKLNENLSFTDIPFVSVDEKQHLGFRYNDDLCVSRGDRACFRLGETVTINIFNHYFEKIVLMKDEGIIREETLDGKSEWVISIDTPGIYSVALENNSEMSDFTSFEVIDTSVEASISGNLLRVQFDSKSGVPEYMVFCQKDGGRFFICDITQEDIQKGHKMVYCQHSLDGVYLKVFFKGDYGRVSNQPIALR